jgi:deazaflavin-dependent oxidoreductase (nitroreductase family)
VNATMQSVFRRLTRVMRPVAMRSAGKAGSSASVVHHVGRVSGHTYETPVVAAVHEDLFYIALPYGERTDWLKNVLAAGSASLIISGRTYRAVTPEVVAMASATGYFRPKEQRLHRRFKVENALRLRRTSGASDDPSSLSR